MNRDFVEMLSELSAAGAEFLKDLVRKKRATGRPQDLLDADTWSGTGNRTSAGTPRPAAGELSRRLHAAHSPVRSMPIIPQSSQAAAGRRPVDNPA